MQIEHVQPPSETEERIFDAALTVFSRKGRDGARMHEIANAAGLNAALLHYYFGSKEDLFVAVLSYSVKRFRESIAEDLRQADTFRDFLKSFVFGFVDFGNNNQEVVRLVMIENMSGGASLGKIFRQSKMSADAPRALFLSAMAEAVERGEIRPTIDPEQTFITVISACVHFLLTYRMIEIGNPEAADRQSFIKRRKEHILDLVYNGVKT